MSRVAFAISGLVLLGGCVAQQRREQYYMVVEPEEQSAAIYKVTAKLNGFGAVKYKLNEGYVPVSVIDALSGKVGEPPDLFSPVSESQSRAVLFNKIQDKRNRALESLAETGDVPGALEHIERANRFFGALAASAAMTPDEQVSIGQTGSTDVYGYRKLVFYAGADVVKLHEFEQDLDELNQSTADLARLVAQKKSAADRESASTQGTAVNMRRVFDAVEAGSVP